MTTSTTPPRKVWTTLVTKPAYVPGLLTVNYTLRRVSKYPLVVMATDTLPASSRKIIRAQGMEIVDVDHLIPAVGQHPGFDIKFARFHDAWTKLRVFGLTQYERVVMIDSDMIFTREMDEIFDLDLPEDWIAAAPACVCNPFKIAHYPADWIPENCALSKQTTFEKLTDPAIPPHDGSRTSHLLNSGMVVLHPNQATMSYFTHFLDTSPFVATVQFADQDTIAEVFRGRWKPLPWWSNALKPGRAAHPDLWSDTEVRLIHYILDKPWDERPEAAKAYENMFTDGQADKEDGLPKALLDLVKNSPPQKGLKNYEEVHTWWWVAYEAMLAGLKAEGDGSGWQEIEANVKR